MERRDFLASSMFGAASALLGAGAVGGNDMSRVAELVSQKLALLTDSYNADAKTLITPVYNVVGYGAKGDGVTDDTAAIQMAVDAVPAAGGTVYFPPGTYKITSSIKLKSNLTLLGGAGAEIQYYSLPAIGSRVSIGAFDADGTQAAFLANIHVEGLTFRAMTVNPPVNRGSGCFFRYATRFSVRKCRFYNAPELGVYVWGCTHFQIDSNYTNGGSVGIQVISAATGYPSTDFSITNNEVDTTAFYQGIDVEGANPDGSQNNHARVLIANNRVKGATEVGIDIINVDGGVVSGNDVTANGQQGIRVFGGTDVNVVGNTCRTNTQYGIQLYGSTRTLVAGNKTQGNTSGGIRLDATPNLVVEARLFGNDSVEGAFTTFGNCTFQYSDGIIFSASNEAVTAGATSVSKNFGFTTSDITYSVFVMPSWNTSVWVSPKSTTGFQINFGTAAPSGATIDYRVSRR